MGARREAIEHLTDAVQELGRQDVAEVLAEARTEARTRVRSMLADALTESMLAQALEQLPPASGGAVERPQPQREFAPGAAAGGDGDPDPDTEPAWYVYGVVRAHEAPAAGELADARRSLTAVTEGELTAMVSPVPAAEFAENELRAHLNDMDWVETVARDHERVLDAICTRTTVIPMRLCTVYETEGGVREMLLRESESLLQALDHLDGKAEWGVKVFFERPRESRVATREPASGERGSGAAYMDDRRRQRDRARQLDEQVESVVATIHEKLDSLSEESTLNQPQRPEVSSHGGEMVLNGAYLVERENESPFHEEIRTLQSRFAENGLELVLTGPWPAYNFLPDGIGAAW